MRPWLLLRRVREPKALAALFAFLFAGLSAVAATTSSALAFDSRSPIALLFVHDPELAPRVAEGEARSDFLAGGTLLFTKAADQPFAPGSIAKIMTAMVVLDGLSKGEIRDSQICPVSEHAWRTGGAPSRRTTMFAAVNSQIALSDLMTGLLVHNANDAAIALAECLSGSEAEFAIRMNHLARKLGLTDSHFVNPTGYGPEDSAGDSTSDDPAAGPAVWSHTTARDLTRLAVAFYTLHPREYALLSAENFTWNGIFQRNKNPLVGDVRGLDGLAAGQSAADGFAALASVQREGLRYFIVTAGSPNADQRSLALKGLLDDAAAVFASERLFDAGEPVADARVHGGTRSTVPLVAARPVEVLLPRAGKLDYRIRVVYSGPLRAPVDEGAPVGEVLVMNDQGVVHRQPLKTAQAVGRGSMTDRALSTLREVLFGWY